MASDLKLILYFIEEAADWLRDKGIDQWNSPWPNEAERDGRVRRGLDASRTWIVEDDGIPIATITCRPDANPDLWTKSERGNLAVYVSRLVVSRSYAGLGVGSELLNWVGMWARKQYGARWIRIDVWTTNIVLHNYYQNKGFHFLRFCDDVDYPSAALFQRSTAGIRSADVPRLKEKPKLIKPDKAVRLAVRRLAQRRQEFFRINQDSGQRRSMVPETCTPASDEMLAKPSNQRR